MWAFRREIFFFFLRKIILIEVLFAKTTSEVLFKSCISKKTHIGLVYLTKHVIFFPSYGTACAWLKVDRFCTENHKLLELA